MSGVDMTDESFEFLPKEKHKKYTSAWSSREHKKKDLDKFIRGDYDNEQSKIGLASNASTMSNKKQRKKKNRA